MPIPQKLAFSYSLQRNPLDLLVENAHTIAAIGFVFT